MRIENQTVRFAIFFSVAFIITFILKVLIIPTTSTHPHSLLDTILSSIYISIIFPSIIFLDEARKKESYSEFKRTRNIFLVSIFLFVWIVNTIPTIIEKHVMGSVIIWSKSLFLGFALAFFSILLICIFGLGQNRTLFKK